MMGVLRRRSVIETSRSLKELCHEARERASKALGFAKMLRKVRPSSSSVYPPAPSAGFRWVCRPPHGLCSVPQDLEIAADFSIAAGIPGLLNALKAKNCVKVGRRKLRCLQLSQTPFRLSVLLSH